MRNRVWRLVRHPVGEARAGDFELREEPVPSLGDGEVLLKHMLLSVDAAQRVYMNGDFTLHEKAGSLVSRGTPLHGWAVGRVIDSRSDRFPVGGYARDLYGDAGVQEYSVLPAEKLIAVDPSVAPLEAYLSVLGLHGLTAYVGLKEVGKPKPGETLVVSAAAAAVGSAAGQLAKIAGCRVVGVTGGKAKCDYLVGELGFDAAVDRHDPDLAAALARACPDGIDVFFDNVGGPVLNECMAQMRQFGRIVFCGGLTAYNADQPVVGPSNYFHILLRQLTWQAYSVPYYDACYGQAIEEMTAWYAAGRLRYRAEVEVGIESYPACLAKVFRGDNFGKLMIRLDNQGETR